METFINRWFIENFGGGISKHPDFQKRLEYLLVDCQPRYEHLTFAEIFFYCQNGYFLSRWKYIFFRSLYYLYMRVSRPFEVTMDF